MYYFIIVHKLEIQLPCLLHIHSCNIRISNIPKYFIKLSLNLDFFNSITYMRTIINSIYLNYIYINLSNLRDQLIKNINKLEVRGTPGPSFQLLQRAGGPFGPFWGPSAPSSVEETAKEDILYLVSKQVLIGQNRSPEVKIRRVPKWS